MDDNYWTALNSGNPVNLEDFSPGIPADLGDWWRWVADREVRVEFPALSTTYHDWEPDLHIDARIDVNDALNTVYIFKWDYYLEDYEAGKLTVDVYFDYTRGYDGSADFDVYAADYTTHPTDRVFSSVYSTDGSYTLENVYWVPPIEEVYQYEGPASLETVGAELYDAASGITLPVPEQFLEMIESLETAPSGDGVLVALLDTGVNRLDGINIAGGIDMAGDDRMKFLPDDDYSDPVGHGTATASAINAIAGDAEIFALKIFDDSGNTMTSIIAEAIRYAVDQGADILAMPFSLALVSPQIADAIDYALNKGVVLIAAAGNDGKEILSTSLAAQDGVIAVGSAEDDGALSAWSNYGSELDLALPCGAEKGTSFSAAYAAGLAALVLAEHPEYTAEEVLVELKSLLSGPQPATVNGPQDQGLYAKVENELEAKQDVLSQQQDELAGTSPEMEGGFVEPIAQ
jgi:subtilisin family serine protease